MVLVFGGISQLAEKRKLKYAKDLEEFKQSLSSKITSIPKENRVEANTQIVMPALENAKYCVEEPSLREMFANLISSSLDIEKQDIVHPSFSDILKTMTPLDAQNLKLIFDNYQLPICNIVRTSDSPSCMSVVLQIYFRNSECTIYERQSLSISFYLNKG